PRVCERQAEAEARPTAMGWLVPGVASVGGGEGADYPQPEPGSFGLPCRARRPGETFEQVRCEGSWHTRSVVDHPDLGPAFLARGCYGDGRCAIVQCVIQIVGEH